MRGKRVTPFTVHCLLFTEYETLLVDLPEMQQSVCRRVGAAPCRPPVDLPVLQPPLPARRVGGDRRALRALSVFGLKLCQARAWPLSRFASGSLDKDRAICVCTHLGLDLRADIFAAQGFGEFFADPTGRAAETSAIDRYAVFLREIDQIDQRWHSDALNIFRNRRV